MTTQTEITQRNHHRAVRFFWGFLIGATTVSLIGNITHAVLPYIPHVVVQIGAAAVPPIALLAAVHGIALAVRAGASGRVYCWAVSAVAAIGIGAFAVSFLALRDLMRGIGYSSATAWIFPAIIDTGGQTSTPRSHLDHARQYTNSNGATVGARCDAERKSRGHTLCTDECAGTEGTSRAGTGLCIGTTRLGTDSARLSANRGDTGRCRDCTGRCRPCVGADCIRCDYTACRDRDRSAGGKP
jgi:hypothetical protein